MKKRYFFYGKKFVSSIRKDGIIQTWGKFFNYILSIIYYNNWMKRNDFKRTDFKSAIQHIYQLKYKPLISIIVPVYNIKEKWLRKCLDSVLSQVYENWELCIADDASDKTHVRTVLEEYQARDKRIRIVYRSVNGHIAAASNSALELASGEFIALLDHDDELAPDALFENVVLLNKHPDADMIYSDEDKIDENGRRHSPYFKPDWSPDNILSHMYTGHFALYRKILIDELGGFRSDFKGAQDYDLVLRVSEKSSKIHHIAKVLYHWRTLSVSSSFDINAKKYRYDAAYRSLEETLSKRKEGGIVHNLDQYPGHYRVTYKCISEPKISIIITDEDNYIIEKYCLESLFANGYSNLEVIILNKGYLDKDMELSFLLKSEKIDFQIVSAEGKTSLSKLINHGIDHAHGEVVFLIDSTIKLQKESLLAEMSGFAMRKSIGAVGAMLLSKDEKIVNAGYILGGKRIKMNSFKGCESTVPGYYGRLLSAANYSAVTGACMMVEKKLFNLVGGFDEELSVAYNDVDFCLKLLEKGYYNVVLPYVRAYHYESHTRGSDFEGEKRERLLKEAAIMQKRWHKYIARDPFYNPNLTLEKEDFSIRV